MSVLIDVNGELTPATQEHSVEEFAPVEIGKPLAIQLLSFFPGTIKNDWGGKAELMITSQTRLGASNRPAPRLVNMMLRGYDFNRALPVVDYGGDVYGDRMLFYTKAYAGQRVGLTLRGVELDKVGDATWNRVTSTMSQVGRLALFAPAAPYLAAAGLAARMAKTMVSAFTRNDRLTIQRTDLFFNAVHKRRLQSGRYLFWSDGPNVRELKTNWRLSGEGDELPNVIVRKSDGELFRASAYLVVQIDARRRRQYDDFEIGAGSAELLARFGDQNLGVSAFQTIAELAAQVNDAKQLGEMRRLLEELSSTACEEQAARIEAKISAHAQLFSKDNGRLISVLLGGFLPPSNGGVAGCFLKAPRYAAGRLILTLDLTASVGSGSGQSSRPRWSQAQNVRSGRDSLPAIKNSAVHGGTPLNYGIK